MSFKQILLLQRSGEGVAVVHRVDVFAQEENVEPVQTGSMQNYYWVAVHTSIDVIITKHLSKSSRSSLLYFTYFIKERWKV